MAGDAGVCVGVKGMLTAREDQKKTNQNQIKTEEKEPYQQHWIPNCASSLEKGLSFSPGWCFKAARLLKLHVSGLVLQRWV